MSQGQGPAKGVKHPELWAQEYKREDRYKALALTWSMGTTDHVRGLTNGVFSHISRANDLQFQSK